MTSTLQSNFQSRIGSVAISGLFLFIGVGLCRFAYTPLIPALINHDWVTKSGAGYLATINFIGYLVGALVAHQISKYLEISHLIKASLILTAISLALCAVNFGFIWLAVWRFTAGVTGALLMVISPGVILKNVPIHYRGRVAGIMFTGMGICIVVSGFLFPALAKISIGIAWLSAALIALIATIVSWSEFSSAKQSNNRLIAAKPVSTCSNSYHQRILLLLAFAYTLYGVGTVPHSLFLVDYVHRELGLNTVVSGLFWSIFGIGSLFGPLCAGLMADKMGTYKSLMISFAICVIAITLVLFHPIIFFYAASSFLMGMFLPGIVTLITARIIELVGTESHPKFWGKMTLYYAISQAGSAYVMSYLLHKGIGYSTCFALAAFAFLLGFIIVCFAKKSKGILA